MVASILPLTLKDATVRKGGKTIIGPMSATIDSTGFTIFMGPNGSGKTTLLRLMHGLEHPRGGSVTWQLPAAQARARQAFVFQTPVMMRRTVVENIAYPLRVRGEVKNRALAQAAQWADTIGLGDALEQNAEVLSGGEKQKLAVARALIVQPEVLFLDEPTANLDGKATREIEGLLLAAQADGVRILMATHHLGQARRLASDIIFLYQGQVHERATAEAFFNTPKTPESKLFLSGDIVE
ncbi:MAG: ATP-binding cassette domain-containing protein [Rhizobiaceae bacterium]|nr:ATP-binding cassette domain-containing protein [Rhizobiaceae bacterium]